MFSKDLVVNFQGFDIRTTQIGYFTPKLLRQWPCGASDKAGEKIGVFFWGDVNARQTALESLQSLPGPSTGVKFQPRKVRQIGAFSEHKFHTRLKDSGIQISHANRMQILVYLETVALEDGMVRFFEAGPQFSNIFREKDWYRTKSATTQKMRQI